MQCDETQLIAPEQQILLLISLVTVLKDDNELLCNRLLGFSLYCQLNFNFLIQKPSHAKK